MKRLLLTAAIFSLAVIQTASAEEVFRINVGRDYDHYSTDELRHRVYDLERAVQQLQNRVFQLEVQGTGPVAKPYTCMLQSFGTTHTASNVSRSAALAMVLKKCSDASNAIHCREADVKCSND